MALYEHVFMARQDASPAQVEALVEQFKGVITAGGGKVGKVESWGIRSISFRVKKNRKAHYTLMNIDAPYAAVAEMERLMLISEDVIRFMTIAVEEHEEGQSAMLRRRAIVTSRLSTKYCLSGPRTSPERCFRKSQSNW